MEIAETYLKDCYVITPNFFYDERGFFFESFNKSVFKTQTGINADFVQINQSNSAMGVLRGLHYQKEQFAQAKLVQVVKGKALDVCVDLRKDSVTFGKYFSLILSENNCKQLYIPRGFAHGFLALEQDTVFSYKCDNFYNKQSETGIIYNDKDINIDWCFNGLRPVLSKKDKELPSFQNFLNER